MKQNGVRLDLARAPRLRAFLACLGIVLVGALGFSAVQALAQEDPGTGTTPTATVPETVSTGGTTDTSGLPPGPDPAPQPAPAPPPPAPPAAVPKPKPKPVVKPKATAPKPDATSRPTATIESPPPPPPPPPAPAPPAPAPAPPAPPPPPPSPPPAPQAVAPASQRPKAKPAKPAAKPKKAKPKPAVTRPVTRPKATKPVTKPKTVRPVKPAPVPPAAIPVGGGGDGVDAYRIVLLGILGLTAIAIGGLAARGQLRRHRRRPGVATTRLAGLDPAAVTAGTPSAVGLPPPGYGRAPLRQGLEIGALRRLWWVLALGVAAAAAAAYAVGIQHSSSYVASARLLVASPDTPYQESTGSGGASSTARSNPADAGLPLVRTPAEAAARYPFLIQSDEIARLRTRTYGPIDGDVTAQAIFSVALEPTKVAPAGVPLINVFAEAGTPKDARTLAQTTAATFVSWVASHQRRGSERIAVGVEQITRPGTVREVEHTSFSVNGVITALLVLLLSVGVALALNWALVRARADRQPAPDPYSDLLGPVGELARTQTTHTVDGASDSAARA